MAREDVYNEAAPTSAHAQYPTPPLSARQREIYDALTEPHAELGRMYLGALHVMGCEENPDRFAQAAHSLREVMEKLWKRSPAPVGVPSSLNQKVRDLKQHWPGDQVFTAYVQETGPFTSNTALRKFLEKCRVFFNWFDQSIPTWREGLGRFLGIYNPMGRRLAPAIERFHVDRWIAVRDDLIAVAHHNRTLTDSECNDLLERFQRLMVDYLRPRTFVEQDEIDRIIAAGEASHG